MANQNVGTYDPGLGSISFCGLIIQGFAPGSFITIEQEETQFKKKVGADGTVARAKVRNKSATVTIKLLQTSASNDDLSALADKDALLPNGAGVGAFLFKDLSGRSVFRANEAWISERPKAEFSDEPGEREWKIDLAVLVRNDGGN